MTRRLLRKPGRPPSCADSPLRAITQAATRPAEATPDVAPRFGTATNRHAERAAKVRDPQLVISRGLASPTSLLEFAWTAVWGHARSLTKPRDRDAVRAITQIDPNKTWTFAIDLSFEEPGGKFTSVHVVFDDLKPAEFGRGAVERRYEGAPRRLGPGVKVVADARDQPAYDASEAWLSIDSVDLAHGRFTGRFSATLQRRPDDLIQASTIRARAFRSKQARSRWTYRACNKPHRELNRSCTQRQQQIIKLA